MRGNGDMIQIKDISVMEGILQVAFDSMIIEILKWVDSEWLNKLVITSGYRAGDTGVHGTDPCRGVDLRSWVFKNPIEIKNLINKYWVYDPDRPKKMVCVYHKVNGGGWHFHVQVCSKTRLRRFSNGEIIREVQNG